MKIKTTFLLALCTAFTASATELSESPSERKLEKKLGIQVTRERAVSPDFKNGTGCAEQQIQRLLSDFRQLRRSEKKGLQSELPSRIARIHVAETGQTTIAGYQSILLLLVRRCGSDSCWNQEVSRKTIADQRVISGPFKAARKLEIGKLTIATPYVDDISEGRFYNTYDESLFQSTSDENSAEFVEALRRARIGVHVDATRSVRCDLMSLSQAVAQEEGQKN